MCCVLCVVCCHSYVLLVCCFKVEEMDFYSWLDKYTPFLGDDPDGPFWMTPRSSWVCYCLFVCF